MPKILWVNQTTAWGDRWRGIAMNSKVKGGRCYIRGDKFEEISDAYDKLVHAADELSRCVAAQLDYMDLCNDNGDFERKMRSALSELKAAKRKEGE